MNKKDIRLHNADYEVREFEEQSKPTKIIGYALKFDKPSEDLGFTEYISRNALDNTKMDNVVALLNHDSNYVLGRTGKNLTLEVDDIGLKFAFETTNTSYTRDLIENMKTGLVNQCSFAFIVGEDGDEWRELENGRYERRIHSIDRLFDISIVTTPAYPDTEAVLSQRTKEKMVNNNRLRDIEIMEMTHKH